MHSSLAGLLVAGFANVVLAADPAFTYGPASNYRKAPAVTASPTGNDLRITPTDVSNEIPAKGVDFFLGPDLQDSLEQTIDGVCAGGDLSKECIEALSVALNPAQQYTNQKRVVCGGLCLGAFAAAVVGIGFGTVKVVNEPQPQPVLSHFHLESTDLAQLSSLTGTTAVLATATDASDHVTVTLTPITVTETAKITTLTASETGHHSGDVLIALPTEPAERLGEILARGADGSCEPRGAVKRADELNYMGVANLAELALRTVPLDVLTSLGFSARDTLPRVTGMAGTSLAALRATAATIDRLNVLVAELQNLVVEAFWAAAENVCTNRQTDITTLVMQWSIIDHDPEPDASNDCPKDMLEWPICERRQCTGVNGHCQTGNEKDCRCLGSTRIYIHPGDENFVNTAYAVMTAMFEPETPAELDYGKAPPYGTPSTLDDGKLACYDIQDSDAHPEWFYDLGGMQAAADNFCEQVTAAGLKWSPAEVPEDPNSEPRSWFENPDLNPSFETQITTGMMWIYGDKSCPTLDLSSEDALEMCKDRLNTIIHSCDTSNSRRVARWKAGGYYEKDCVHWEIGFPRFTPDCDQDTVECDGGHYHWVHS